MKLSIAGVMLSVLGVLIGRAVGLAVIERLRAGEPLTVSIAAETTATVLWQAGQPSAQPVTLTISGGQGGSIASVPFVLGPGQTPTWTLSAGGGMQAIVMPADLSAPKWMASRAADNDVLLSLTHPSWQQHSAWVVYFRVNADSWQQTSTVPGPGASAVELQGTAAGTVQWSVWAFAGTGEIPAMPPQ